MTPICPIAMKGLNVWIYKILLIQNQVLLSKIDKYELNQIIRIVLKRAGGKRGQLRSKYSQMWIDRQVLFRN